MEINSLSFVEWFEIQDDTVRGWPENMCRADIYGWTEKAWNEALRTDPVKAQMLEALEYVEEEMGPFECVREAIQAAKEEQG